MKDRARQCFARLLGASTGVQHNGQSVRFAAAHCGMTKPSPTRASPEPAMVKWKSPVHSESSNSPTATGTMTQMTNHKSAASRKRATVEEVLMEEVLR